MLPAIGQAGEVSVMRIATWNVNSLKARLEKVSWWLERARPDVLLMQETKLADADAPVAAFRDGELSEIRRKVKALVPHYLVRLRAGRAATACGAAATAWAAWAA